jgi:hypothetical protein
MLLVKNSNHLGLAHEEDRARRDGRRRPHPHPLTRKTPFAEELARSEHRHDGFFTGFRED